MYSFVFSNNIKYRLLRHVAFWLSWFIYFITIYSLRPGSSFIGFNSFLQYTIIEMAILMSVDVVFCYSVIYLLVPRYLIKGRYFLFFPLFLIFLTISSKCSAPDFFIAFTSSLRIRKSVQ